MKQKHTGNTPGRDHASSPAAEFGFDGSLPQMLLHNPGLHRNKRDPPRSDRWIAARESQRMSRKQTTDRAGEMASDAHPLRHRNSTSSDHRPRARLITAPAVDLVPAMPSL